MAQIGDLQQNVTTRIRFEFKNLFLKWSQSVTFHCFPKIFKEKTKFAMRFILTLIFLIFSGLTCYILANDVIAYFEYKVVSTIQVVNEETSVFPAVTICNSNPYVTKYAENLTQTLALEYIGIQLETISSFLFYITYIPNKFASYMSLYINDPAFGDAKRKDLGTNFPEIVTSCYFDLQACNITRDFQWFFHSFYGNCIQFNANSFDLKSSFYAGKLHGLQLILGPLINRNKYPVTLSTGLKVLINNQSITPNFASDNFISIEPGKETDIIVDRIFTSNSPQPFSSCTDLAKGFKSELYNFIINSNKTYRQIDCIDLCFQRYIQNECDCFDSRYSYIYQTLPCLNSTQSSCLLKAYDFFDKLSCLQDCPLECDWLTYNLQVSSLKFPNPELYNIFRNDSGAPLYFSSKYGIDISSIDIFSEYFYSINIYYSSLKYTYISESPQTTVFGLLSGLGGSLGMFLGFSVFSLLEVFEIVFELIWHLIFSKL
jgi:hypothetical protein